jgi:hypothetical protein
MYLPLNELDGSARVWVYNTKEFVSPEVIRVILERTADFIKEWTAHQNDLYGGCGFAHFRHLIIAVDETKAAASGCSIDSCVHFLQDLGKELDIDFFDRLNYTFVDSTDQAFKIAHHDLDEAYQQGDINDQTLFVDPTVKTLDEFHEQFIKPLAHSFQYRFISSVPAS